MLPRIFPFVFILLSNFASFQPKTFKYYSYKDIMATFTSLARTCPHYIKIDTSQSRYNLDHVPGCNGANCENLIVYLTDFDTYTLSRPHYYISGLVHGNEEIGPTSLVEFAMYFCNGTANASADNKSFHILKSKLFIFTPMTNAFGYANEQREDRVIIKNTSEMKLVDPNRDFPYFDYNHSDVSEQCMQTLTSRTVNEIFNEHIVQAAITFHGGINVLGYAWGNFIHAVRNGHQYKSTESPDHNAFHHIGMAMKQASSSNTNANSDIPDYILGDMSSLVYPVNGGMEDWAYAGSWENEITKDIRPIKQCRPNTFSDYHVQWESNEDNSDYKLRCLMYLAETSHVKKPKESTLGNDNNINDVFDFEKHNDFYGHVIRNMRLIYAGADLIFASIYIEMSKIVINNDDYEMVVPFTLMGCYSVRNVSLFSINYYALSKEMLGETFFNKATLTLVKSLPDDGSNNNNNNSSLQCYWSNYSQTYSFSIPTRKHFSTNRTFDADIKGNIYFLRGEAPDELWSAQEHADPSVLPQSHVVRSKSNVSYDVSNGNYTAKSNYYFYSHPIVVSDKYPPLIVDDVDSLFYPAQNDLTFIPLEYTTLPNDYTIHYNTLLTLKSNISRPTLTSAVEYDVHLYMTLDHKDSSQNEKYSNKISEYVAQAHVALSNVTEKYNFNDITCTVEEYTTHDYQYKQIIIKCKSILSQIRTLHPSNGYFIRNFLSNSFVSFSTVASAQTLPIKVVGVFSMDNTSSGRFYPSIKRLTLSCGSFIQSTLIPQIQSPLSYNMTISKVSNTNINVTFHAKDVNYTYLIIVPFAKDNFIINSTYNSTFQLNISENVNSKLIGKTIYVYKLVGNHSVELVSNLTKGKHNSLSYVKDIINVLNSNTNSVIYGRCTLLSNALYIVYNNKEILAKIVNASELNYTQTNANHMLNMVIKYIVISIVTIFILGFITRNMIKRLCGGCCVKGYDRLQTKREIEIMSFKI